MALKTFNPTTPSQRQLVIASTLLALVKRAGQGADGRSDQERRVATTSVASRPRFIGGGHAACIV